jgi:Na+-translocating ferredoxin:NAD+ oxidoreductase RNF subunit RnfB
MGAADRQNNSAHYVRIDEARCNGCVLCMKVCPTKAIRVREGGVARIEDVCINCGECIRICPRNAIRAVTAERDLSELRDFAAVSASTVLYSQFGEGVMPNDILLALRNMGIGYVHDQSYTSEMFTLALEFHIKEKRREADATFPMISPVCPVVVRLIFHRFPSLLKHIPPLITPREIVAREAKKRLSAKRGARPEDIRVLHITPCPAKMLCIKEPVIHSRSYLDHTVGISTIFDPIRRNIQELDDDVVLHHSGGAGLAWGMSGGEIVGIDGNCLAISGIRETILYLEKIEMGLMSHIDYVEFRTCAEGCLGGPFTVADKYQAKHTLEKLVRMFGAERRVKYDYVQRLYEQGWFFSDMPSRLVTDFPHPASSSDIARRIERQNRVEEILKVLPRKECGICGAPDCRTFAEDVVDGKAEMKACRLL